MVSVTGKIPNASHVIISSLFANRTHFKVEESTINCLMLPRILLLSDIRQCIFHFNIIIWTLYENRKPLVFLHTQRINIFPSERKMKYIHIAQPQQHPQTQDHHMPFIFLFLFFFFFCILGNAQHKRFHLCFGRILKWWKLTRLTSV